LFNYLMSLSFGRFLEYLTGGIARAGRHDRCDMAHALYRHAGRILA
jgi:hypothetical protein